MALLTEPGGDTATGTPSNASFGWSGIDCRRCSRFFRSGRGILATFGSSWRCILGLVMVMLPGELVLEASPAALLFACFGTFGLGIVVAFSYCWSWIGSVAFRSSRSAFTWTTLCLCAFFGRAGSLFGAFSLAAFGVTALFTGIRGGRIGFIRVTGQGVFDSRDELLGVFVDRVHLLWMDDDR